MNQHRMILRIAEQLEYLGELVRFAHAVARHRVGNVPNVQSASNLWLVAGFARVQTNNGFDAMLPDGFFQMTRAKLTGAKQDVRLNNVQTFRHRFPPSFVEHAI